MSDSSRGPLKEVEHQVTYGNGRSTEETEGMTLRELLLEVREDLKEHRKLPHDGVTPKQVAFVLGAYSTLLISLHALFVR